MRMFSFYQDRRSGGRKRNLALPNFTYRKLLTKKHIGLQRHNLERARRALVRYNGGVFTMQVLQAGPYKLIYLELQAEMVATIARQAGFETKTKETPRTIQVDLSTPAGRRRCCCSMPPIPPTWAGFRAASSMWTAARAR